MNLRISSRFARFFVVGVSGVGVNMGTLILLTEAFGIRYAVSSLFAIELSILSNFALNNAWTWADRRTAPIWQRILKYHAVAGFTAVSVNWCLLVLLTSQFGVDYRISNALGIAAGMMLNFIFNHVWTFRARTAGSAGDWSQGLWGWAWAGGGFNLRGIPSRWREAVLYLLGAVLVLRIVTMGWMTLLPEEAYYWMYSQHPSLSYYDHPPMVAWLIGLGTQLFGNTEFGVRIGIALLMMASSAMMYAFGRIWFGREAALVGALLLQVLPISLAGFAVREGALVLFLHSYLDAHGLPDSRAIAAGLLWYACMLIVSMLGAPAFAFGQRQPPSQNQPERLEHDRA